MLPEFHLLRTAQLELTTIEQKLLLLQTAKLVHQENTVQLEDPLQMVIVQLDTTVKHQLLLHPRLEVELTLETAQQAIIAQPGLETQFSAHQEPSVEILEDGYLVTVQVVLQEAIALSQH